MVILAFANFFLKNSKRRIPKTIMGGLQINMHLSTDIWIFCVFVNSYQRLMKTKIRKKNLDIQENLNIIILSFEQNLNICYLLTAFSASSKTPHLRKKNVAYMKLKRINSDLYLIASEHSLFSVIGEILKELLSSVKKQTGVVIKI